MHSNVAGISKVSSSSSGLNKSCGNHTCVRCCCSISVGNEASLQCINTAARVLGSCGCCIGDGCNSSESSSSCSVESLNATSCCWCCWSSNGSKGTILVHGPYIGEVVSEASVSSLISLSSCDCSSWRSSGSFELWEACASEGWSGSSTRTW